MLTACDAGHRDHPGKDNKSPGADLRIQVPGRWTKAAPKLGHELKVAFDLRDERAGQTIHWRLAGDDRIHTVEDPKRAQGIPTASTDGRPGLPVGQHLLIAWVQNEDGSYASNPGSVAISPFYYAPISLQPVKDANGEVKKGDDGEAETSWQPVPGDPRADLYKLGHIDEKGQYQRFDERAPAIVAGAGSRDGTTIRIPFTVANEALGGSLRLRVYYESDKGSNVVIVDTAGMLSLPNAKEGRQDIELTLERRTGSGDEATWKALPGRMGSAVVRVN